MEPTATKYQFLRKRCEGKVCFLMCSSENFIIGVFHWKWTKRHIRTMMGRVFTRKWNLKLSELYLPTVWWRKCAWGTPEELPTVPPGSGGIHLEHRLVYEMLCTHFCACLYTYFVVLDGHGKTLCRVLALCVLVFVTGTVYSVSNRMTTRNIIGCVALEGDPRQRRWYSD